MDNNQNNSNKNNNRRSGGFLSYLIIFMLISLLGIWLIRFFNNDSANEITYNEFLQMVESGKVEKVIIHPDTIEIKETQGEKKVTDLFFGSSKASLYKT